MERITKKEMEYLKSRGFKNKEDIHKTVATGKKASYFATESYEVMKCLLAFRSSIGMDV